MCRQLWRNHKWCFCTSFNCFPGFWDILDTVFNQCYSEIKHIGWFFFFIKYVIINFSTNDEVKYALFTEYSFLQYLQPVFKPFLIPIFNTGKQLPLSMAVMQIEKWTIFTQVHSILVMLTSENLLLYIYQNISMIFNSIFENYWTNTA